MMQPEELEHFQSLALWDRDPAIKAYKKHNRTQSVKLIIKQIKGVQLHSSAECFVAGWKKRAELE